MNFNDNPLDYASESDDQLSLDVMAKAHDLRVLRDARRIVAAEDRPPVRKPELVTLRERLTRPRSPVQWRIAGWQPANSRVMLAAQFKAGKTTVVANRERSLVDGDPFLDAHDVTPIDGTVVTVDLEMSAHQLDGWHTDQKIRNEDRVIVIPLRGSAAAFDILDPGIRTQWADMLKAHGCGYLIVDCLRPILDALGLDEQREAGRFLTCLDALLSEAEIPDAAVSTTWATSPRDPAATRASGTGPTSSGGSSARTTIRPRRGTSPRTGVTSTSRNHYSPMTGQPGGWRSAAVHGRTRRLGSHLPTSSSSWARRTASPATRSRRR
jgi:hypothetical protein